ncbi:MAG: hypothetical protein ACLFSQ_04715 [Candidatus Zixiibacteriota bacterium]
MYRYLILIYAIIITFAQPARLPERTYEDPRTELMTICFDGNYYAGDAGRFGGGLDMAFNLPGGLVLGFNATGGSILTDLENNYYFDENHIFDSLGTTYIRSSDSIIYRGKLSDGEFSLFFGYELKPQSKLNPYFTAGIGFYFISYEVARPMRQIVNPSPDTFYYDYTYNERKESSDIFAIMPITLGVNSRVLDWLQASAYIRYQLYFDDLILYVAEDNSPNAYKADDIEENVSDMRGHFGFGIKLGFPIKAEL